jgi:tripartite-type tricarboxylate transporter receptor subunit TctC
MKKSYKHYCILFIIFSFIFTLAGVTGAQSTYPSRPIHIVVANPPGGQTDLVTRIIAEKLGSKIGQPVIIDNKPGANTNLGAHFVARSAPDGYTLIVTAINNFGANPALIKNMPFDPIKDFKMIVHTISSTNALVVNPKSKFYHLKDILDAARAEPGKLTYGSAGLGSSMHLFMEMIKMMAKVDIMNVPYQGSAPADTALMGNIISMVFDSMPGCWSLVQAGKLRAVAVSSAKRSPAAPDIPTVAESGLPGYEAESYLGFAAPAGTPNEIIQKLNKEVNEVLVTPEISEKLLKMGTRPVGGSPEQFHDFISKQIAHWAKVMAAAGVKPQ